MKKTSILFYTLQLLVALAFGQTGLNSQRLVVTAISPKGNYIYLYSVVEPAMKNAAALETDYFIISRSLFDSAQSTQSESDMKQIGESKRLSSVKELKQFFPTDQLAQLKNLQHLKNDEQLAAYFKTHANAEDYGFAYLLVEIRQALGEVFLDDNVKAGELYRYAITRVTKSGEKQNWGYNVTRAGSGNQQLNNYVPKLADRVISDSAITYNWQLPLLSKLRSNTKKEAVISGLVTELNPATIRGNVHLLVDGKFVEVKKLIATLSKTGDTAIYSYMKTVVPGQSLTAFLTTEDEVYNPGISSDTVTTYAVTSQFVPLIKKVVVRDIENGICLSWDRLPAKSYITGILITRYVDNEQPDTLIILPISDTSFKDYTMAVGKHYTYLVKALYSQYNIEQKIPANTVGTVTVFSKPLPAYNLKAINTGRNVLLSWEIIKDRGFFGAYIFRGISPDKLDRIAGPVFTTSYLDSAASLSGRSPYYYAVVTQNLRQDTSEHSDQVKIIPDRKIESEPANMIRFFYANLVLHVDWNDVRKRDQAIAAFVIQRRMKGEISFKTISTHPVANNFFDDSTVVPGISYQYRVATVNFKGDAGTYGETSEFEATKKEVALINVFFIRNVAEGVHVSWPQVTIKNRKGYNIFRREASGEVFTKIASLNRDTFFYIDQKVTPKVNYVYSMSITEADDRSGERGESKSITREQVAAARIL